MKKRISSLLSCVVALSGAVAYGCIERGNNPVEENASSLAQTSFTATESTERFDLAEAYVAASPSVNDEYISPLVTLRADPYLYKHKPTGTYYFTGSYPTYDRIELTAADSVNGIAAAVPKTVWTNPDKGNGTRYVWAPEIHYVMGQWVIYFTLSVGSEWSIKCCALRLKGDDPMRDEWEYMGVIGTTNDDGFSFDGFSLDMTAFENNGKWYAVWAQKDGDSNVYIAEFEKDNPFKLRTKATLLTRPEYSWEKTRLAVNEGPSVLKHAGKIFVVYSAAATGYEYCMGMLEIDETDDPLVRSNWKKYDQPVFQTDASKNIYGPGHNSFVEGDNGEQLCILHFRQYKDIIGGNDNSLYDYNRHAHVMKITFDRNGVPQFNLSPDELYNSQYTNHQK